MSDNKRQLNPLLLLIAILLCLSAGFLFHRTTFDPEYKIPSRHTSVIKKAQSTPTPVITQKPKATAGISAAPSATAKPSVAPTTSATQAAQETPSPQASSGVWTSSGSNWMFMVDGSPYTGWLIDTDGKHYFFDKDGIMQTGWVDDNSKRYYMDMDGIMQTGTITVDGKTYELQSDGSLKK